MNGHDLQGVIPALVTPLSQNRDVDVASTESLVDFVLDAGVTGLLVLGSTGESASLDGPQRRLMVSTVIAASAGSVPIIGGVTQTTLVGAVAEVQMLALAKADVALVVPPFYYPTDQATVLSFYRELAAASPIPLMVYNIPQFTKVGVNPATVAELAREGTIIGIKDSSRDFEYFEQVCAATRDIGSFRAFTGSDTMLLASLVMGGAGTICGAANVAPLWVLDVYNNYREGNSGAARHAQDLLLELAIRLRLGTFPAAVKAALAELGICEPWLARPGNRLDDAFSADLKLYLEAVGLSTTRVISKRRRH